VSETSRAKGATPLAWGILLPVRDSSPKRPVRVPAAHSRMCGWLAASLLLAWLPACGALLGVEEGTLEDAGTEGGTRTDGAKGPHDAGDAGDARKNAKDAQIPLSDAGAPPRGDGGPVTVYVSVEGSPSMPCGSKTEPCLTVHDGVATAKTVMSPGGIATVWVAQGAYTESVTLVSGVSIQGGYAADWTLADGGPPTTIIGVEGATLTAKDLTSPVKLSSLTLESTPSPGLGKSVYGIFATSSNDAGAPLTLENVVIELGPAGDGTPGLAGATGAAAPEMCSSGNPFMGGVGPDAPDNGTFSASGFTPARGSSGLPGGTGPCVNGCVTVLACDPTSEPAVCATGGVGGCGGGGGAGGTGGGGGGSSVALFVWNVPVTVQGGALGAGNGGNGAMGGPGGTGAPGGAAPAPPTVECIASCAYQPGCVNTKESAAGAAGSVGGQGGSGGHGGGGAGGSSYSVYSGGAYSPSFSGTTYSQGNAGGGTPSGTVAQQGEF
jgi:hypothetical protein